MAKAKRAPVSPIVNKKKKIVVRVIRQIWESLDSHLDATHENTARCKTCGSKKFHAQCVEEYAGLIHDLSKLL